MTAYAILIILDYACLDPPRRSNRVRRSTLKALGASLLSSMTFAIHCKPHLSYLILRRLVNSTWHDSPLCLRHQPRKLNPRIPWLSSKQALTQPDRIDFIRAMEREIHDHTARGHFHLVPCSSIVDLDNRPLPAVWSMKCKRRFDRMV